MSEDRFGSVWDALEHTPAEAANMKARAGMMIAIQQAVGRWNIPQAEAAARLRITQPRLSDLLRGKIDRFSLDALTALATDAGLNIEMTLTAGPTWRPDRPGTLAIRSAESADAAAA
jgi:predicted XRE-type DNA-binding protein